MLDVLNEGINQIIQNHDEDWESDVPHKQYYFSLKNVKSNNCDEDESADVIKIDWRLPVTGACGPLV